MGLNDTDGMANSVDPDQTVPLGAVGSMFTLFAHTCLSKTLGPLIQYDSFEPRLNKTSKMSVRPAKTQISLGIHPVWSESSLPTWRKLGSLATH